ncbi:unnamed protein product [Protopolystoma xenopodis]|uniref:Uncharacterized protein n=1 Tax=Protopolystoma xenopodis TaxID=117903 RepID=A0A448WPT1_9PLAT|nr:unnamed protein product [Protopolystoma xenopodis]
MVAKPSYVLLTHPDCIEASATCDSPSERILDCNFAPGINEEVVAAVPSIDLHRVPLELLQFVSRPTILHGKTFRYILSIKFTFRQMNDAFYRSR